MTPIHYTTRVLSDGHLPLPPDFPAATGQEIEVTLSTPVLADGETEARKRAEHILTHWLGIGRGSGTGIAEKHDDALYGR